MHFKQFFRQLRQQRLFSTIYIVCTALSVALAMILFLVLYIKFGPVYPEQDRAHLAVVNKVTNIHEASGTRNTSHTGLGLADTLRAMPEVERVTTFNEGADLINGGDLVGTPDGRSLPCKMWMVDEHYWQVFGFRFTHGRPISADEVKNGSPVCVVSESLARRAFGRTDVVGRELEFGDSRIDTVKKIVGVVRDVSPATPMTYGHLWMGIPTWMYDERLAGRISGVFMQVIRLRPGCTVEQLQRRVARFQEHSNQEHASMGWTVDLMGQPDAYWAAPFRVGEQLDTKPFKRQILYLALAFLLLPAINMGSMVAGRVGGRISELGIRRAYGATRTGLVWQVLKENFLLTLVGGVVGLLLSWFILTVCADWLPFVFNSYDMPLEESVRLHADMLFSGWTVLTVLCVCMVLNLVAALLPTLWFLRKPVTESLNYKQD